MESLRLTTPEERGVKPLYEILDNPGSQDKRLVMNIHQGQAEVLNAKERIILVLAGTQSGKTVIGPLWLYNEIKKKGPGDYAAVAPTFMLMEPKVIPEFKRLFEETLELGKYISSPFRRFVFSKEGLIKTFGNAKRPCTVYFGYAENPESLESATYKAVWCDEAGQQKFRYESYEALRRRVAVNKGRILFTTTPYQFGWLKTQIHDKSMDVGGPDPNIRIIRFESVMNPAFDLEEFEYAQNTMPSWKFDMMYRAIWRRPAGTIYDCFDEKLHTIRPFRIPEEWPRLVGLDFGQTNTCAVFGAIEPGTDRIYIYRTYHTGGKSASQHVESILHKEQGVPYAVGGARSEDEWRAKFSEEGLPVCQPVVEGVEEGIDLVYEALKTGRLFFFNNLSLLIGEMHSYSRELDSNLEPTDTIADKNAYHRLDALRYLISDFMNGQGQGVRVVRPRWY